MNPTVHRIISKNGFYISCWLLLFLFGIGGCNTHPYQQSQRAIDINTPTEISGSHSIEIPIQSIPLTGPASLSQAEFSGMAWYQDQLILLPQYPSRMSGDGSGALLAISRQQILDFLQGKVTQPIEPRKIPLISNGIEQEILLFEGYEAIAFHGQRVFLAIEARSGVKMLGYLVSGEITGDLSEIRLDRESLTENPPQQQQQNRTDEALLIAGEQLLTFFESNGEKANPESHATIFDFNLNFITTVDVPAVEYRLTDATEMGENGSFWMINYFFPGDADLLPDKDPLADQFGKGLTHSQSDAVERLVEFSYNSDGITFTETPPIQIKLDPVLSPRNWEGLVRLEGLGFLLVTDKFPETILGFLPYP